MIINIQCTNIESTTSIVSYAREKFEGVEKYFDHVQRVDIDVGIRNHHHQKGKIFYAEANVSVPGKLIRVEKEAENLYKAVDKVKDHLKVEFERMKGKMRAKDRVLLREQKGYRE